jgi:hypothetical protein
MEVPGSQLVVQLPLSSFWGTVAEIDARDRLAAAIERALKRQGCGKYDGKDTGSGTTNLYFYDIPDDAWDQALRLVVAALRRRKLAEKAVVARCDFVPQGADVEVVNRVIWPPDFQGEMQPCPLGNGRPDPAA